MNVNSYIDNLIDDSIEEINLKIDDYIDIDYFATLSEIDEYSSIKYSLNTSDINQEQYNAVIKTVSKIYSKLNKEELDLIKEFSKEDDDIKDMLLLIECNFKDEFIKNNVIKLTAGVLIISSILNSASISNAAIITIKAFFLLLLKQ